MENENLAYWKFQKEITSHFLKLYKETLIILDKSIVFISSLSNKQVLAGMSTIVETEKIRRETLKNIKDTSKTLYFIEKQINENK